ncbi:MAG: arylesterase [Saprospiraceae bacterium]
MNYQIIGLLLLLLAFGACSDEKKSSEVKTGNKAVSEEPQPEPTKKKNIIFFGNSLTAAYGLDPSDGYVSLIQQRLDSLGLPYKAINAGLSGETTAGGKERVNWVIRQPVDVFVLELGGNDALRGIPPASSKENLEAIILSVKAKYPAAKIILAGMEAPPNMGENYTKEFREMYPALAEKHGISLIPFFLDNVAGIPELNQGDRVHPNEKGQFILVENVWRVLEGVL